MTIATIERPTDVPPELWVAYNAGYVTDCYRQAAELVHHVIGMQQDYQRFTPALEMLWDTAALLYRNEDEQVKRAGYRLALHVLAETPEVCPGLAKTALSEITKYEVVPHQ